MADKTYRITLWSGGKPAMVHYVTETPRLSEGVCAFRTEDNTVVRLMGNISIEEGTFEERRISNRIGR
jgi:hypothetical protein